MRARIATAPAFRFGRPDEAHVDELVRGYEHITGDPVRRPAKRNLVAACYRVHGDELLPLVQQVYARTGTATNLLGEIRGTEPSSDWPATEQPFEAAEATTQRSSRFAPGVIYPADDPPPFDPTSTRRYDRHPSNPDAAGLFSDDELRTAPRRSPTAEALSR